MNREQIIQMAQQCGFTKTHSGVVNLWLANADDLEAFAKLVAQCERDELTVMFLEAHEGAKDNHNYWHVAANKIKEKK